MFSMSDVKIMHFPLKAMSSARAPVIGIFAPYDIGQTITRPQSDVICALRKRLTGAVFRVIYAI